MTKTLNNEFTDVVWGCGAIFSLPASKGSFINFLAEKGARIPELTGKNAALVFARSGSGLLDRLIANSGKLAG